MVRPRSSTRTSCAGSSLEIAGVEVHHVFARRRRIYSAGPWVRMLVSRAAQRRADRLIKQCSARAMEGQVFSGLLKRIAGCGRTRRCTPGVEGVLQRQPLLLERCVEIGRCPGCSATIELPAPPSAAAGCAGPVRSAPWTRRSRAPSDPARRPGRWASPARCPRSMHRTTRSVWPCA